MQNPICDEDTCLIQLKIGGKFTFIGQRRFLPKNHAYCNKKKPFNGEIENGIASHPLNVEQVYNKVKDSDKNFGKSSENEMPSRPLKKIQLFLNSGIGSCYSYITTLL